MGSYRKKQQARELLNCNKTTAFWKRPFLSNAMLPSFFTQGPHHDSQSVSHAVNFSEKSAAPAIATHYYYSFKTN